MVDYASTIIEARQADSPNVVRNGEYEVRLTGDPLVLNEGDALTLRSAFIDTKNVDLDALVLEQDTTFTFKYYIYSTDYAKVQSNAATGVDEITSILLTKTYGQDASGNFSGADTPAIKDYHPLLVPHIASELSQNESQLITKITFAVDLSKVPAGQHTWGNHSVNITYETPLGKIQNYVLHVILLATSILTAEFPVKIIAKPDTLRFSASDLNAIYAANDPVVTTSNVQGNFLVPKLFERSFRVTAGSYDPVDFCGIINEAMTILPNKNDNFPNGLTKDDKGDFTAFIMSYDGTSSNNDFYYVNAIDGSKVFKFFNQDADKSRVIGSSQFTLLYDAETRRYKFQFLHSPLFIKDNITTGYLRNLLPFGRNQNRRFLCNLGGIMFNSIETIYEDGTNIDLFSTMLGFDVKTLFTQPQHTQAPFYSYSMAGNGWKNSINSNQYYTFTMRDQNNVGVRAGSNFTQNENTIDGVQNKDTANNTTDFYLQQIININSADNINFFQTSENTTEIFANKVDNNALPFAYFLVNIDASFKTNLVSQKTLRRNLHGIINRYYAVGSYVSAGEESSILYIHRGLQPIYFDSFRIMITDPDGQQPQEIGEDNTIFLQIQRATKKN